MTTVSGAALAGVSADFAKFRESLVASPTTGDQPPQEKRVSRAASIVFLRPVFSPVKEEVIQACIDRLYPKDLPRQRALRFRKAMPPGFQSRVASFYRQQVELSDGQSKRSVAMPVSTYPAPPKKASDLPKAKFLSADSRKKEASPDAYL